ncbi:MAG: WecB/TagA/CpsF family glycosyltransferase [Thermodesulfobacteriota bacterium]
MDQLVDIIDSFVRQPKNIAHTIVLLNPHLLLEAIKNPEYKEYIKRADIVTADGIGILLAGWLLGRRFPERVTGTDLMPRLGDLCAKKGYSLYLLGGEPGIAEKAKQSFEKKYPAIKIVGTHHGYFGPEEEQTIVMEINSKGTDILVVCMGAYKQEMFIQRHLRQLNVSVCFGNGAAFDFMTGKLKRAPVFMQRHGIEWLFRLIIEPRRLWRRYLIGNAVFLWLIIKALIKKA